MRNEDHCEHNAIEKEEKKEENQQFDNKLKEEKKNSRPTQVFRDRIRLCVFFSLPPLTHTKKTKKKRNVYVYKYERSSQTRILNNCGNDAVADGDV